MLVVFVRVCFCFMRLKLLNECAHCFFVIIGHAAMSELISDGRDEFFEADFGVLHPAEKKGGGMNTKVSTRSVSQQG